MTLDEFFEIGVTIPIGTHHFDAESIKAFARKYDPQPFHTDEDLARSSVFGGLCASGWQTAAAWMKRNLSTLPRSWTGTGPAPVFGPSPGITNLKWLKPVYAGETVSYSRTALSYRPIASRPGWLVLNVGAEGIDSTGDKVIEFESAVLVKVE
ncbi:MAG: MaoC family dehydratase [Rhizobiaceae bacterium]|nr:MaoC family dehydratase [Rhizobiaceae bacterium]